MRDDTGLSGEADAIRGGRAEGRRSDAQGRIGGNVRDLLAVGNIDDGAAGVARWAAHADRLALSVPWYGIPDGEQVAIFRRLLSELKGL